ncbi:uncharacterized protein [Setaria viridis]|uniref:uncharacterized protein isoform X6 n=1 Tax=Setaria viridis TaxID=4556 RepID=UPI0014937F5C|nr:uncharacterized protein LOC117848928 isoform X5 [Setaria viridis]
MSGRRKKPPDGRTAGVTLEITVPGALLGLDGMGKKERGGQGPVMTYQCCGSVWRHRTTRIYLQEDIIWWTRGTQFVKAIWDRIKVLGTIWRNSTEERLIVWRRNSTSTISVFAMLSNEHLACSNPGGIFCGKFHYMIERDEQREEKNNVEGHQGDCQVQRHGICKGRLRGCLLEYLLACRRSHALEPAEVAPFLLARDRTHGGAACWRT